MSQHSVLDNCIRRYWINGRPHIDIFIKMHCVNPTALILSKSITNKYKVSTNCYRRSKISCPILIIWNNLFFKNPSIFLRSFIYKSTSSTLPSFTRRPNYHKITINGDRMTKVVFNCSLYVWKNFIYNNILFI